MKGPKDTVEFFRNLPLEEHNRRINNIIEGMKKREAWFKEILELNEEAKKKELNE